jgi:hypothetical protein
VSAGRLPNCFVRLGSCSWRGCASWQVACLVVDLGWLGNLLTWITRELADQPEIL